MAQDGETKLDLWEQRIRLIRNGGSLLVWAMLIGLLVTRFDGASATIAEFSNRITTIEAFGQKLSLSPQILNREVTGLLPVDVRESYKKRHQDIPELLQSLGAREIRRLLVVESLDPPCDYEKPDSFMADEYAADLRLRELGFIKFEADDTITARNRNIANQALDSQRPWSIGRPRFCYKVKLTDVGTDLKSTLVHLMAAQFNASRNPESPPLAEKVAKLEK